METKNLPTNNNLLKLKSSIKQSKEGRMLLEQKKMILNRELEKYKKEAQKRKEKGQKLLEQAFHDLKIANSQMGIDDMIDISDGIKIDNSIDIKYKTIMGVEIPSIVFEEQKVSLNYGLNHTTSSVDKAILKFMEVKQYILEMAQLENIVFRLEKDIEKVQRRSNALKEIIIPKDEKLAEQIEEILEENDKEEFIRLKKLKSRQRN